jgi:hypothetical protein
MLVLAGLPESAVTFFADSQELEPSESLSQAVNEDEREHSFG